MKLGDMVRISPDLSKLGYWADAKIIEIDNNPFVGLVVSAETEDGNVFFGQADFFAPQA